MRVGRVVVPDARKLSWPALVGAVVAAVVLIVGLPVALAAQAPSSSSYLAVPPVPAVDPGTIPGILSATDAQERLREQREHRATTAEREARRLSRTRFGGRGLSAALQAAREGFGPLMNRPGWKAPQLRSGEQIVGYAGDHLTKLKLPDRAEQAVMYTPYPARVKDDDGVKRPLDLTLVERSTSFVTANAAVDVRLPKALSEGITLGESGVSVRVPTTTATSTATQVVGKAFWSDVETDVDLLVAPLPEGFETTHMLRSEVSSERLALLIDRPADSVLRYTEPAMSAAPAALGSMASAQQRGVEVVQNGTVIAMIAPPSSVDADGEAVPTRLEIEDDRVTLIVRHRDGDFKYPIAADPVFSGWVMDDNNWRAGYSSFTGWNFAETNAGYFRQAAGSPANLYGNGLYLSAYGNSGYCCGQFAHWYYFAPGTSYIYRADLTGINHGASGSNYFSGIANNNGWQKSWFSGAQISNGSTTLCVSDCGPSGATPGNYFSFGMQMLGATGPYGAIASLGRAALYLSDNDSPSVTSVSHAGLDSSWRSGGTVTTYVSGSDLGLGLDYGEVTSDNGQIFKPQLTSCGDRDSRCPNTSTGTYTYNLDQIDEGVHQVKARVRDVVQHFSDASAPWTIRIDRTAPTTTISGDLVQDGDNYVSGQQNVSVAVASSESAPLNAGVARVALEDGTSELPGTAVDVSCPITSGARQCPSATPAGGIPLSLATNGLSEGNHQVRAVGRDDAGNRGPSDPTTVIVDKTSPAFSPSAAVFAKRDASAQRAVALWEPAIDPDLPDGSAGSGTSRYDVRYKVGPAPWSTLTRVNMPRAVLPDVVVGQEISLEIIPIDSVDNVGSAKTVALTVEPGGSVCEATAEGYPSECDGDYAAPEVDDGEEPVDMIEEPGLRSADNSAARYRIDVKSGDWATFRSYSSSYVIGNVRDGWTFDRLADDSDFGPLSYTYGKVRGSNGFESCGWVQARFQVAPSGPVVANCPATKKYKATDFTDAVSCNECTGGRTYNVSKQMLDALPDKAMQVCLNIDPSPLIYTDNPKCRNGTKQRITRARLDSEPDGTYALQWRYITRGKTQYVMVQDREYYNDGKRADGQWVFIPRRDFRDRHLCNKPTDENRFDCNIFPP
jgi:hypothetical protein